MKYGLTTMLSMSAICAFLCAAPTSAYALSRHAHAKAARENSYPTPYPQRYGYDAYSPGYYAYVPGYGTPVGVLHHPTGCGNCPPQ